MDRREGAQPDLTQKEYEVLAAFRLALRRFQRASDENVKAARLTPHQHQVLLVLKGGYPGSSETTVRELANAMLVKHHSAVELVGRMAKAGLVSRRRSETDRRQVMIGITAKGEDALRSLSKVNLISLRSAAPQLSDLLAVLAAQGFG